MLRFRPATLCAALSAAALHFICLPLPSLASGVQDDASRAALDRIERDYLDEEYKDVVERSGLLLREMPGAAEARFLRGAAYWQLGYRQAAVADLEEYVRSGGRFRDEAQAILEQARGAKPERLLLYGARVGLMRSDRVIRRELARGDPRRESTDTALRLAWSLESGSARPWTVKYGGSTLEYFEVEEASWISESLDLIGRWPVAAGRGLIELRVGGEYARRDAGPDLWRAAGRLEMDWAFDRVNRGWAAVEAAYDDYPADSEFNGAPFLAGAGFEHRFSRSAFFWDLYGLVQESRLDAVSHFETGGRAGVVLKINDRLKTGCVLRVSDAEFDNYEAIFSTERSDLYYSAEAWASCRVGKGWRVSPFFEYAANHSNIEGDDYNRVIFGLDLIWGAL